MSSNQFVREIPQSVNEFTYLNVGYDNASNERSQDGGNTIGKDYDTYWTQVFGEGEGNSNSELETEQSDVNLENNNSNKNNSDNEIATEQSETNTESEFVLGMESVDTEDEDSNIETEMNAGSDNFDRQVLQLVNNERADAGLDSLSIDSQLDRAADLHTNEMIQADKMSHQLSGEAELGDRVSDSGYNWGYVAENIAAGQTTPEEVVEGWMNSSKHRDNILDPKFTHMGVGYGNAPDDDDSYNDQDTYWTQVFAAEI